MSHVAIEHCINTVYVCACILVHVTCIFVVCMFSITFLQGCTDINDFVAANKMQELQIVHIVAAETEDYYIYIKSTVHWLSC